MNFVLYSCEEHVDCIIDDCLNLYNDVPQFDFIKDCNNKCCDYCHNFAKYIISSVKL